MYPEEDELARIIEDEFIANGIVPSKNEEVMEKVMKELAQSDVAEYFLPTEKIIAYTQDVIQPRVHRLK
jgi:hypothetical protein